MLPYPDRITFSQVLPEELVRAEPQELELLKVEEVVELVFPWGNL